MKILLIYAAGAGAILVPATAYCLARGWRAHYWTWWGAAAVAITWPVSVPAIAYAAVLALKKEIETPETPEEKTR